MNATQLKQTTKRAIKVDRSASIFYKIREHMLTAANNGHYKCMYTFENNYNNVTINSIIKTLEDEGYKIDYYKPSSYLIIDWS